MPGVFLGPWGLAAYLCLVGAAAWAIYWPRARSTDDALVGTAAWSAAVVVACATALSAVRALTAPALLAVTGAVAGAGWAWRLHRRRAGPTVGPDPSGHGRWWVVATVPTAAFAAGMALAIWSGAETGADNLAYHLPRLGYWLQQRAVAPFVAGNVRAGSFPPNGNVLQLPLVLFLGHDRFCGVVQLLAAVLTGAAVHRTARALGATGFGAAMAALCWLAIPCMLEQAGRSLVDVTAAFFVAAAASFVASRAQGVLAPLSALACIVIAAGVKTPTLVLALPLVAAGIRRLGRVRGRRLGLAAIVVLVAWLALGGVYVIECARVWSDPVGLPSLRWVVAHPSLASLLKNAELVGLPLNSLACGLRSANPRALWSALTGYGYGAGWLGLAAITGALLLGAVVRRRVEAGAFAALWAAAAGGALVMCVALRHQDAVLRFLLPAAALITPTFGWTFDRLGRTPASRVALAALTCLGVGVLLWRWTGNERASRHRDGRPLARTERFGPDLEPLARALDALDLGGGARFGLLTPDYFPEAVFFGPRYRNHLVALSYEPPRSQEEVERLDLRALWVDTRGGCTMTLFRRDFRREAAWRETSWRASPDAYDEDFVRAYAESVYRVDLKPTVRALADPGPGWGVWHRSPAGVLLVRGRGQRVDVQELCGVP